MTFRSEKIPQIIACCFILYNIAKHLKDDDFRLGEISGDNLEHVKIEDENVTVRERKNIWRIDIANVIYQTNQQLVIMYEIYYRTKFVLLGVIYLIFYFDLTQKKQIFKT